MSSTEFLTSLPIKVYYDQLTTCFVAEPKSMTPIIVKITRAQDPQQLYYTSCIEVTQNISDIAVAVWGYG